MRNSTEFEVDGARYRTTKYPATKGLKILTRLSQVAGEPMAMLMSEDLDKDVSPSFVGAAVRALVEKLDEDLVEMLVKDILSGTDIIDGSKTRPVLPCFDEEFAGRFGHLFKVLKEIVGFQYGDFFGGLAETGGAFLNKVPTSKIKAKKQG